MAFEEEMQGYDKADIGKQNRTERHGLHVATHEQYIYESRNESGLLAQVISRKEVVDRQSLQHDQNKGTHNRHALHILHGIENHLIQRHIELGGKDLRRIDKSRNPKYQRQYYKQKQLQRIILLENVYQHDLSLFLYLFTSYFTEQREKGYIFATQTPFQNRKTPQNLITSAIPFYPNAVRVSFVIEW